jgi:peptidoglycan/LPS O-acetylase OafA/YrhL
MNKNEAIKSLIKLLIVLLIVVGLGYVSSVLLKHSSCLSFSMLSIAFISFFGFLWIYSCDNQEFKVDEQSLQNTIATTIVIVYLALVTTVVFFKEYQEELPKITETLLINFTVIVGIIIAFYFGSTAIEKIKK